MLVSEGPIVVEQSFNQTREVVWKAITDLSQMQQWYFDKLEAFEPTVGFETQFTIEHNGRTFPHTWKILEVIQNEKISYNWKNPNYPGNSIVSFEISTKDDQTNLKVTAVATEDYPQDIPEFKRESGVGGWTYLINESLKKFLDA